MRWSEHEYFDVPRRNDVFKLTHPSKLMEVKWVSLHTNKDDMGITAGFLKNQITMMEFMLTCSSLNWLALEQQSYAAILLVMLMLTWALLQDHASISLA